MFFRKHSNHGNEIDFDSENLQNVIHVLKNLKSTKLDLSNKNITFNTIKSLERQFLGLNNINSLDLSNNLIGDTGLKLLVPFLSKKNIKILNLSCANLTNYSVKLIKTIIENNTSLEELNLQLNHYTGKNFELFSDDGIIDILGLYKKSENLKGISIFGNPFESELLLETFVNVHDKKCSNFVSHEKIMNVAGGYIEINKDFILQKEILGKGQYGEVIK
jgi:hypothetical protein